MSFDILDPLKIGGVISSIFYENLFVAEFSTQKDQEYLKQSWSNLISIEIKNFFDFDEGSLYDFFLEKICVLLQDLVGQAFLIFVDIDI